MKNTFLKGSNNINYNNAKGSKPTYGSNFPSSQYGREGEGLKWNGGQDVAHQNYGVVYFNFIIGKNITIILFYRKQSNI